MDRQTFRDKVQAYCGYLGKSQSALAKALNLHPSVLSNKLNGTRNAALVLAEIKQLICTLAQWQAFSTQAEVIELLTLLDLKPNFFTPQEWNTPPFNLLDKTSDSEVFALSNFNNSSRAGESKAATRTAELVEAAILPVITTPVRHNLPAQLTALVGRNSEIEAVKGLLLRADVRLVTLTGPGGVGKTRLASTVAAELIDDFEAGVRFVKLAPVADPQLIPAALAQALEIKDEGKQPLLQSLLNYLRDKQMLLVADNYEQLLDSAHILFELLENCPRLKILVTSRSLLQLYGEYEFAVPPLSLPVGTVSSKLTTAEIAALSDYEAIALFVQRGRAARYDFALTPENVATIIKICQSLDGLPLALELAAARLKLFTPAELLQQLINNNAEHNAPNRLRLEVLSNSDRFLTPRQRAITNTIEWSYKLLKPHEKILFQRLGVFAGGFRPEAVKAVCFDDATVSELEVLEQLGELLNHSLLRSLPDAEPQPRFGLLVIIREYALNKLAESGELAIIKQRHALYFSQLAKTTESKLRKMDEPIWIKYLDNEFSNFNVALEWLTQNKDLKQLSQLVEPLSFYWYQGSRTSDAERWLELILQIDDEVEPNKKLTKKERASLLLILGTAYWQHGDYARNKRCDEAALAIYQELSDKTLMIRVLQNMAISANDQGDSEQAISLHRQCLALYEQLEESEKNFILETYIANNYNSLGILMLHSNDLAAAENYFEQALAIFKKDNDGRSEAGGLLNLGNVALARQDYDAAKSLYEQSLALFEKLDTKRGIAMAQRNLGQISQFQNQPEQARLLYLQSLRLRWEIGDKKGIASSLEGLGSVAISTHQPEQAIELLAVAAKLRETLNTPLKQQELRVYEEDLAKLKQELDPAIFALKWEQSSQISLEKLVKSLID